MIRLQKWLADAGIASRRKAEEYIADGRVSVNGVIITELGFKADPAIDILEVDGKIVDTNNERELIYVMLHKPEGVVTTVTDPFGRSTVMDYLTELTSKGVRLFPVGRLDYDTSGLLLLTNDGIWAQKLMHPSYEVKKTYMAIVKGIPTKGALDNFRTGIIIDGQQTVPSEIKIESIKNGNAKLRITIHEGRNRQVRKMCEAINCPVITLKRVAIGALKLGNLPSGKWRYLSNNEI